jgi:CMP/dCMP kinase
MIIVIDGPSGSGKSTMAKMLAKKLMMVYFDTGAMYRAVCWLLIENKINLEDEKSIKKSLSELNLEVVTNGDTQNFFVNGIDVTEKIRREEVTKNVSKIAAYPYVREHLVKIQREFGRNKNAIFEGRDMGTVVFPNADLKFFFRADPNIRAHRRYLELLKMYPDQKFDEKQILTDISKRDNYDSQREHSPLRKADDAIEINTSNLSQEQVLEKMQEIVERRRDET